MFNFAAVNSELQSVRVMALRVDFLSLRMHRSVLVIDKWTNILSWSNARSWNNAGSWKNAEVRGALTVRVKIKHLDVSLIVRRLRQDRLHCFSKIYENVIIETLSLAGLKL